MAGTTLTNRAVIRLSGEDVRDFLQGLVTSDVAGPLPVWAGLLSAQGKCLFDFVIWDDGDDLLLDCETDAVEHAMARARRIRACASLAIAGWVLLMGPPLDGWSIVSGSAFAKAALSSAISFGSNATRPSSTASASPRAASSARRIRRE
jgi:hypothetical protein